MVPGKLSAGATLSKIFQRSTNSPNVAGGSWRKLIVGGGSPPPIFTRGIKSTSAIHPTPVHQDDERVLKKVLEERQNSDDLPETMANPYEKTKKKCILCEYGIEPNYKNTKLLYQFTSPFTGRVYSKNITGLCKHKHKRVEEEINIALNFGFMSDHVKEVEFLKDPKICDPDRPVKPHSY